MTSLTVPAPAIRESEALKQLVRRLEEMFQLDRGDLDFGIYRIMNFRRDEILRFLRSELPARAEDAVRAAGIGDGAAALRRELDKAIAGAREAGFDPEASPRVRELRAEIARAGSSAPDALLDQIWTALDRFFGRYYDEGDFIAQRRGRDGAYLIPYEGEEVTLHWANKDQYYVKSSESFANYVFRLGDGRAVRFRTAAADTERDNNKEAKGKQRRFRLAEDQPLAEEDGDLIVRFTYRADEDDKRKQDALNAEIAETILALPEAAGWTAGLAAPAPTDKDGNRRLIDKHLTAFTAKNSFDYFIHKDLKGFLTRELDLFIDREVLNRRALNEARRANRMEQIAAELAKAEAVERIATEVIEFLAQIEEFQKRLWLKKKFVLDTQWCLTLDRIDAKFHPEIAANEAQRREWVELFAIDEIRAERLGDVAYSEPLTEAFLRANPFLVLDTKHFDEDFKARLLASIDDLDDRMDGLLVHGDNFQALNLFKVFFSEKISTVYIDPPYNTDAEPILYKNDYKSSSWGTMIENRLRLTKELMDFSGVICMTIDDYQQRELSYIGESVFGRDNAAATVSIRSNPAGRPTPTGFAQAHEYAIFYRASSDAEVAKLPRSEEKLKRYKEDDDDGKFMWELFRKRGSGSERKDRPTLFYPIYSGPNGIRVPRMDWDRRARVWVVHEAPSFGEEEFWPIDENGVERRWRGAPESIIKNPENYRVQAGRSDFRTVYYKYRPDQDGIIPSTSWSDSRYSATEHGTGTIKDMFQDYKVFDYPKSIFAVEDCIWISGMNKGEGWCLDYYGGSGTTAHAVINLNRRGDGKDARRFVLVEVGKHFDRVLLPRVKKAVYSAEWSDGRPLRKGGISHAFKYIRLESYEDALENLALAERPKALEDLFSAKDRQAGPGRMSELRIRYMLSRMLATEAKGASLLDLDGFRDPTGYTLAVLRDGVETPVRVDLVETFSWLIGMTVKKLHAPRRYRSAFVRDRHGRLVWPRRADGRIDRAGFRADADGPHWFRLVEGALPGGEPAVVIWRSLTGDAETDNLALDAFAEIAGLNARDSEVRVVWVNGDNNLQNLRLAAPASEDGETEEDAEAPPIAVKVRLIEEDFQRLMFADTDTTGIL